MRLIDRTDWLSAMTELHADGFSYLDVLTGLDRGSDVEVLARVVDVSAGRLRAEVVTTLVPRVDPHLSSVAAGYPAAVWHERETAEMFDIVFDGHPDPRPLLRRTDLGAAPLLKSTVLAARVVTPWPGTSEGESGRRSTRRPQPLGVPANWLHGGDA